MKKESEAQEMLLKEEQENLKRDRLANARERYKSPMRIREGKMGRGAGAAGGPVDAAVSVSSERGEEDQVWWGGGDLHSELAVVPGVRVVHGGPRGGAEAALPTGDPPATTAAVLPVVQKKGYTAAAKRGVRNLPPSGPSPKKPPREGMRRVSDVGAGPAVSKTSAARAPVATGGAKRTSEKLSDAGGERTFEEKFARNNVLSEQIAARKIDRDSDRGEEENPPRKTIASSPNDSSHPSSKQSVRTDREARFVCNDHNIQRVNDPPPDNDPFGVLFPDYNGELPADYIKSAVGGLDVLVGGQHDVSDAPPSPTSMTQEDFLDPPPEHPDHLDFDDVLLSPRSHLRGERGRKKSSLSTRATKQTGPAYSVPSPSKHPPAPRGGGNFPLIFRSKKEVVSHLNAGGAAPARGVVHDPVRVRKKNEGDGGGEKQGGTNIGVEAGRGAHDGRSADLEPGRGSHEAATGRRDRRLPPKPTWRQPPIAAPSAEDIFREMKGARRGC